MSNFENLLIQIDTDALANPVNWIAGHDAGAAAVLPINGVTLDKIPKIVYEIIFPRPAEQLCHLALFFCGADVGLVESMMARAVQIFPPGLSVSTMVDARGSNTVAAAVVSRVIVAAAGAEKRAVVLGGTGRIGPKVAELLAEEGWAVRLCGVPREMMGDRYNEEQVRRDIDRVQKSCSTPGIAVEEKVPDLESLSRMLSEVTAVIATGPTGFCILPERTWADVDSVKVLADVNVVPPSGIKGVNPQDDGELRWGKRVYGALAVAQFKMAVQRTCVRRLFERNDRVLRLREIYQVARQMAQAEGPP